MSSVPSNIETAILGFANYYYIPDIIKCLDDVLGKTGTYANKDKRSVNEEVVESTGGGVVETKGDDTQQDLAEIKQQIEILCSDDNQQEVLLRLVRDEFRRVEDDNECKVGGKNFDEISEELAKEICANRQKSLPNLLQKFLVDTHKKKKLKWYPDKADEDTPKHLKSGKPASKERVKIRQQNFNKFKEKLIERINKHNFKKFGKKIMNKYTKEVRKIAKKKGIYIIYRDGTKFLGVSFNKNGKYSKKKGKPDVKNYSYDQIRKMKNRDVKWTELEKLVNKMNITTVKRKFGDLHFGFELKSKRGCNQFGYKFPQGASRGHASAALFDKL